MPASAVAPPSREPYGYLGRPGLPDRRKPAGGSGRGAICRAEKISDYVPGLLALRVRNPL
ncbi:MAG TPA: hypothetical protein VMD09_18295 [Solirubrobacteraceae bacterium]|nr:hypothetical protein [Solirubrobacteraceae bacterium]